MNAESSDSRIEPNGRAPEPLPAIYRRELLRDLGLSERTVRNLESLISIARRVPESRRKPTRPAERRKLAAEARLQIERLAKALAPIGSDAVWHHLDDAGRDALLSLYQSLHGFDQVLEAVERRNGGDVARAAPRGETHFAVGLLRHVHAEVASYGWAMHSGEGPFLKACAIVLRQAQVSGSVEYLVDAYLTSDRRITDG